jgi:hypothetical protein
MHGLLDFATATPRMAWAHGVLAVERDKPRDKIQITIVLRLRTPVLRLASPDSSLGSGQTSILVLLASCRLDILCLDFFSPEAASQSALLFSIDRD